MTGRVLAHFQILEAVGRGGMGEVYRGLDTRLGREVAIKVLPDEICQDAERLGRFEREARVLATLNHPNIASIYSLEESEGRRHLILEYVGGETLQSMLKRGPLPLLEAITVCRQIAEAVEAAHEKAVVHRDLKPGNIMVDPGGTVKVLDFGLAKVLTVEAAQPPGGSRLTESPTLIAERTGAGVILGTAAYMSPEQALGKPVDKRTDVWSFGCVAFECLAGQPAFQGKTASDLVGAILQQEPRWGLLPERLPERLCRLLKRCLAKDPRQRLHDMGDVRIELQELETEVRHPPGAVESITWGEVAAAAGKPFRPRMAEWRKLARWAGAVAVALVGCLLGLLLARMASDRVLGPSTGARPQRFTVELPDPVQVVYAGAAPLGIGRPALAISPDGSRIVFAGTAKGVTGLFVRPLDSYEPRFLPGTEGAYQPFFSPDGQWVGFFAEDRVKKTRVSGGMPIVLSEVANPMGASWVRPDWMLVSNREGAELAVLSSSGHPERTLAVNGDFPDVAPDGSHALVSSRGRILLVDLRDGAQTFLAEGSHARFLSMTSIVYLQLRRNQLLAATLDWRGKTLVGEAVPLLSGMRMEGERQAGQYCFSSNGTFAYVEGGYAGVCEFVWVSREGRVEPAGLPAGVYGTFRLAPDDRRLLVEVFGVQKDLWIFDLLQGGGLKLTHAEEVGSPIWIPGEDSFVFCRKREGGTAIEIRNASGLGATRTVASAEPYRDLEIYPYCFTPDGALLGVYVRHSLTNHPDILFLPMADAGEVIPLATSPFAEWGPTCSPRANYVAYTGDESGRYEVYIQPLRPTGERWKVSAGGGEEPLWSPGGDELFYRNGKRWMVAAVRTEPTFAHEAPQPLFEGDFMNVPGISYGVASDGQRFLCLRSTATDTGAPRINVVVNWFEEIHSKVSND